MTGTPQADTEDLLRELRPQVLGALVRRFGDLAAAEDALQEALLAAATHWPVDGLPDNPRGWLIQAAHRRMTDAIRADAARRNRESIAAGLEPTRPPDVTTPDRDDTLTLFFLCCHPALPPASAIALTLRAVGGLTTAEIARAFLLPEATMAQRITRAKKRVATLDRPFAMPPPGQWHERLGAVLHVLYLIFTEGHASTSGPEVRRADLSAEAIRLARAVHRLLPDDPEVAGLLALMLLTDAHRAARTGPRGELIPLAEQDRRRWDRAAITEGVRLTTAAMAYGLTGPYRIQAAIAVLHAQAPSTDATDWGGILALYRLLERVAPNPLVTLNLAVATAMVYGPAAGLDLIAACPDRLPRTHRLAAVRAHLYEMAGDTSRAVTDYTVAANTTPSVAERDYLVLRAARLRGEVEPDRS
ncbi:RNA polymerase sigma factor [Rhodococcus daqingensis]|uniref:RNA polymerase sigma factor n=1 Tax=Rhodococcus daqingensis TaxID=2479363 RepID=A0ABW2S511_9NOCA